MKSVIKTIITRILIILAKRRIRKISPRIIGITGSLGKTTVKNAVYAILSSKYKVEKTTKSFNTEIGICLSILGEKQSGFTSVRKWAGILLRSFFHAKKKYDILIVEMGADKPHDLDALFNIIKPDIGIITAVAPVHLENGQFKNMEDIFNEKKKIVSCLSNRGVAIINNDDKFLRKIKTKAKRITFGIVEKSDFQAKNIKNTLKGLEFTLYHKKHIYSFKVPVLGRYQAYNFMPAAAVALEFGISIKDSARLLRDKFYLPPGRMTPIPGMKHSLILDSSYNASPLAVKEALGLLNDLSAKRKIAVIGNMNELGEFSKKLHEEIGRITAGIADFIIFIGPQANILANGVQKTGFPANKLKIFKDSIQAGKWFKGHIYEGDLILVKGSQNKIRLEKFIKEIMAEPEQAGKLLCRQEKEWKVI